MRSGSSETTNAFASSSSSRIRFRARAAGQQIGQFTVDAIEQGGAQQQLLHLLRLAVQHLGDQILGDRPVAAGELRDETLRVGVTGQRDHREPQARGPPFRPLMQPRRSGLRQRDTRGIEQLACFALAEAQIGRADLGQLAGQAQLMQAQREIATRRQHRMHVVGKVCQQPGQLSERVRRGQLVQVVDDQDETAAMAGELREHSVDHRPPIEVGCRGRRLPRDWRCRRPGGPR